MNKLENFYFNLEKTKNPSTTKLKSFDAEMINGPFRSWTIFHLAKGHYAFFLLNFLLFKKADCKINDQESFPLIIIIPIETKQLLCPFPDERAVDRNAFNQAQ